MNNSNTFRTTFKIPRADHPISHRDSLFLLGSCFSVNIGERLKRYHFQSCTNPFGILFHPLALAQALNRITEGRLYGREELHHHGNWLSFDHHTSFNHPNPERCLEGINRSLEQAMEHWQTTNHLFLTFGTAWVYERKGTGQVVANCHKIPGTEFSKRLLTVEEILQTWEPLIGHVLENRPEIKVIFTLSPVRHWKDGAVENQRSKSVLHLAIQALVERYPACHYFPAYELVLDDLRDYRFFADDLLHPNELALDYVWQHFKETWISAESEPLMKELEQLYQAAEHRSQFPESKEHQQFLETQLSRLQRLEGRNPHVNFSFLKEKFQAI